MTSAERRFDAALEGQPALQSVTFGDALDWASPLVPVDLLVELPFWLLIDDCELDLPLEPAQITVRVHDKHREVYVGEVRDSRATLVYRGLRPELMHPDIKRIAAEQGPAACTTALTAITAIPMRRDRGRSNCTQPEDQDKPADRQSPTPTQRPPRSGRQRSRGTALHKEGGGSALRDDWRCCQSD